MKDRHGNEFVSSIATTIIRNVAELPDRNSPEGQPEMMLVTADELRMIVTEAIAAAPKFEAPEVTRPMCHGAWARFWSEPNSGDSCDQAKRWLEAWRSELGPTLGLVEIREPTPEECERISMAYYDDEALVDRDHRHLGKDMFAAVRAVMWPKSEGL